MDGRNPRYRISHPHRLMELELAARPHAPGQGDRGQEAAALGMSVRADFGLAVERQEVEPVPECGSGVPEAGRSAGRSSVADKAA